MRTYRLEIRLLQIAVLMTIIVMLFGVINVWRGADGVPPAGNPAHNGELPTDPGEDPEIGRASWRETV